MTAVSEWIKNNSGLALTAFALMVVLLGGLLAVLWLRIGRIESKWRRLLEGSASQALEPLLLEHLRRADQMGSDIDALRARIETQELKMAGSIRYFGVVRFNAFDDVAGEQSFSMAAYDEGGNGYVMTALVGRSDSRVYCKDLVEGRSDRGLSDEETEAVREAGMGRQRAKAAR